MNPIETKQVIAERRIAQIVTPVVGVGLSQPQRDISGFGIAAINLSGQRAVYAAADGLRYASKDDLTADQVIGITKGAVLAGQPVQYVAVGEIDDPSFAWALGTIYLGSNGLLTQVIPLTGSRVELARAMSSTKIMINVQQAIFLE